MFKERSVDTSLGVVTFDTIDNDPSKIAIYSNGNEKPSGYIDMMFDLERPKGVKVPKMIEYGYFDEHGDAIKISNIGYKQLDTKVRNDMDEDSTHEDYVNALDKLDEWDDIIREIVDYIEIYSS